MKKAIVFRALLTAGVLICSSQVMAQGIEIADKNSNWAFSFEQLKEWIFSARSSGAARAKSLTSPDDISPPPDPTCSNQVTEAWRGVQLPPCDRPPVPPRPINPNERPKPGTCIGCGES